MGRNLNTKKGIGWRLHLLLSVWLVFLLYLIIGYSLPYSFYTKVDEVTTLDSCVGSAILDVNAKRSPRWTMAGTTYAEMVRIDGDSVYETTYRRGTRKDPTDWTYEAGTYEVEYGTRWNTPIESEGVYAIRSWNTINPLPLIYIEDFTSEEESNQFNVTVCDTQHQ